MAKAFRGELVSLFVESPRTQAMSDDERAKLAANIALAEQLGAHMETVYGDDVAFQISEFAPVGYFKIVMGRTGERSSVRQGPFRPQIFVEQLITFALNLDILHHSRPVDSAPPGPATPPCARPAAAQQSRETCFARWPSCVATAIGTAFRHLGFADSSIISSISSRPC